MKAACGGLREFRSRLSLRKLATTPQVQSRRMHEGATVEKEDEVYRRADVSTRCTCLVGIPPPVKLVIQLPKKTV
jgi:hypothetical protein